MMNIIIASRMFKGLPDLAVLRAAAALRSVGFEPQTLRHLRADP